LGYFPAILGLHAIFTSGELIMGQKQAPGPPLGWFAMKSAREFSRDPLGFTERMVREYGPVVELRFGPVRAFLAVGPEAVQQVLVSRSKSFCKERRNRDAVREIDGEGIITTEGDFWLRQRRLVQKGFAADRMAHYADVTVARTLQMLDRWPKRGEVEICNEMTCLTLAIIAETMFKVDLADQAQELAEQAEYLSERLVEDLSKAVKVPTWFPTPAQARKRRALRALHEMVRRVVHERRAEGVDKGDMLSMLLLAVDTEGDGSRMTEAQACDEITTLFVAGYDTTASGLAWTWCLLAQHPEAAREAAAEAARVLNDRVACAEDYEKLSFIRQVIQESLRLYPPAWMLMLREATEDTELMGYAIPRKSWVFLVPWATHRSARWFPDPLRFDPGRFAPERVEEIPDHAYFPFGLGGHRCIGERLALMEMTLVVATVLRRCRLCLAPEQGLVEVEPHTAIRPRGGLRVLVEHSRQEGPGYLRLRNERQNTHWSYQSADST
jgi:cytochrome P450